MSASWEHPVVVLGATILLSLCGSAQELPVLASFTAIDREDGIHLDWVMMSGNTCEGITVLRSENGTDFTVIGGIEGLCGSITEPIAYTFTDANVPELTTVHYRLILGLNGNSPILSVHSSRIRSTDIRLYPVPVIDLLNIVIRTGDRSDVELSLFTADGRWLGTWTGLRGHAHTLPVADLASGSYLLRAVADGVPRLARFIVP